MVTIRPAERSDAAGIAAVRVAGWRAAYCGILEDAVLDAMDVEQDTVRYLEGWDSGPTRRVAGDRGLIVGFSATRPYRMDAGDRQEWPGANDDGEISALYVAPTHWSRGVGRALMTDALATLRAAGHRTARLWVLRDNARARRFYTAAGFTDEEPAGVVKPFRPPGAIHAVDEVRYSRSLQ